MCNPLKDVGILAYRIQNFFRMADEPNWNLNFVDFDDNSMSRFIDVSKDTLTSLLLNRRTKI